MRKREYEGSPADKREDAKEAKKRGMSQADYERSGADKKADAAGQKKLDASIRANHGTSAKKR